VTARTVFLETRNPLDISLCIRCCVTTQKNSARPLWLRQCFRVELNETYRRTMTPDSRTALSPLVVGKSMYP
jgi:hypothetical protein